MTDTMLIRTDASPEIGTGHVMRCLALAQAWSDQGSRVVFAMAESTLGVRNRIRTEGFEFLAVPAEIGTRQDCGFLCRTAKECDASWLVLDGYHFDRDYQHRLSNGRPWRLLCIDDEGLLAGCKADLILNQNLHASASLYKANHEARVLLGVNYGLLRREFLSWKGHTRSAPEVVKSILVSLGGGAQIKVANTVLSALLRMRLPESKVTFITGSASVDELENSSRPGAVSFVTNPSNMPDLMANADVAISAAGATCWEIAFLGVPSLVIDVAPNQTPIAQALARGGYAVHVGSGGGWSAEILAYRLRHLIFSRETRQLLSDRCRTLVDGRGAQKVVAAMADVARTRPSSWDLVTRE